MNCLHICVLQTHDTLTDQATYHWALRRAALMLWPAVSSTRGLSAGVNMVLNWTIFSPNKEKSFPLKEAMNQSWLACTLNLQCFTSRAHGYFTTSKRPTALPLTGIGQGVRSQIHQIQSCSQPNFLEQRTSINSTVISFHQQSWTSCTINDVDIFKTEHKRLFKQTCQKFTLVCSFHWYFYDLKHVWNSNTVPTVYQPQIPFLF